MSTASLAAQCNAWRSELGLEGLPNVDARDFADSDRILLSARVTDGGITINNFAKIMGEDIAEFDPRGVFPQFTEVHSIEIRKKDLKSAKIGKGGATVYSAEQFRILGRGYLGAQLGGRIRANSEGASSAVADLQDLTKGWHLLGQLKQFQSNRTVLADCFHKSA